MIQHHENRERLDRRGLLDCAGGADREAGKRRPAPPILDGKRGESGEQHERVQDLVGRVAAELSQQRVEQCASERGGPVVAAAQRIEAYRRKRGERHGDDFQRRKRWPEHELRQSEKGEEAWRLDVEGADIRGRSLDPEIRDLGVETVVGSVEREKWDADDRGPGGEQGKHDPGLARPMRPSRRSPSVSTVRRVKASEGESAHKADSKLSSFMLRKIRS